MALSSRVIVVRGDLYSDTGYGRATRALGATLATLSDHVFGTSLHEHDSRRHNSVDFPIVSDLDLRCDSAFRDAVVLHVCLPDFFVRFARAFNIGYFFWETESLPPTRFWKAQMLKMDRLWAPSRWQSETFTIVSDRDDIPVVPWPLAGVKDVCESCDASLSKVRVHRAMTAAELDNYHMRSSPGDGRTLEKEFEEAEHAKGHSPRYDPSRAIPLRQLLAERQGDLFVAVQTDAPRKGLQLLLASWLQFKASDEGRDATLLIKISSLDVAADFFRLHFHMSLAVRNISRRCGIASADIWFIHDRLSSGEMRALLRRADTLVSATLGEGFGGPIAEALIEGTPVITPRHTSIQDLIEANYPLTVASRPCHLKLWHNLDVYSAASLWHVVEDESLVACFKAFARMPDARRRAIANGARKALLVRAGRQAVGDTLRRELALCDELLLSSPT